MRIPRSGSGDSEEAVINLSPMLDVLFILIIFFLATATFKQQEYDEKVNLPQASEGKKTISDAPKVLVINVRKSGNYVIADQRLDLEQLKSRIAQAVSDNPRQKVLIRGDRKALHQYVAAAVHACRQAGVAEANIGYDSNP